MNYRTPIKGLRSRFYRIRLLLDGRYGPSGHGSPGGISAFSLGVPVVLLHGVDGSGGYRDEIITFGLLGFAFAPYWQLVIGMTAGAILGSWVGTKVRAYVPENVFRHGVRILITVLAVRMLLQGFGILN